MALQSLRRTGGVSGERPPVVHAVSAGRHRGWNSGRLDALAISGDACEGRSDRETVRAFWPAFGSEGLHRSPLSAYTSADVLVLFRSPSNFWLSCRLSVGRDRGKAQGTRLTQSDSSACELQSSAIEGAGERKPQKEPDSGSRRARIRCSANLPGWSDRKDDRHRAGESHNRPPEPRLQHPPSCHAGAHGYRMRE